MKLINWIFNNNIDHIISVFIIIIYIINNYKKIINKYNFQVIWFVFIFIIDLVYCICNWEKVIVFSPFSGDSALLILLLILALMPFIYKIKIGENEFNIVTLQAFEQLNESKEIFNKEKALQQSNEKKSITDKEGKNE